MLPSVTQIMLFASNTGLMLPNNRYAIENVPILATQCSKPDTTKRMGVFATRSPFRPNPIGLSCVRLEQVCLDGKEAPYLMVSGVDMMDDTPVYDIKPYLAYTDSHADAVCGFADTVMDHGLQVVIPEELKAEVPPEKWAGLIGLLKQDIRPGYLHAPDRVFGVSFAGMNIKFTVNNNSAYSLRHSKIIECYRKGRYH